MEKNCEDKNIPNKSFLKKYPSISAGFFAFCVIAAGISFYFIMLRIDSVGAFFSKFLNIIEPVIYGLAIAFLLNPLMTAMEKFFLKRELSNGAETISKRKRSVVRSSSILISILVACLVIYIIASFLFPEISNSLSNISKSLPKQVDSLQIWAMNIIENNKLLSENFDNLFKAVTDYTTEWLNTGLSSKVEILVGYVTSGITSIFDVVFNLVIGLACSIYILYNKEKFLGQCKKLLYAFFKPQSAQTAIKISKESLDIFTHSIIGKIIDSIIIGLICFLGVKLMKMPYPVLISVIVGITNVIPFFGPWLGALPCGLIILLTNPIQAVYFGLFILALQQFDCNFLTPKIVGNYIGLPAFWVLVACLIGGGFYGILGLVLGVPAFAILYHLFRNYVSHRLESRHLPSKTSEYEQSGEVLKDTIVPKD